MALVLVPVPVPPPPPPPPPPLPLPLHPAIPRTKARATSPAAALMLHRNCFSFPPKTRKAIPTIAARAVAAAKYKRGLPLGRAPILGGTLAVVVIVTTVDADW